MTPRGVVAALGLALASHTAAAQQVTFQPAAAEDARVAEERFDAEARSLGRPISAALRRRLHERLALVTTLRRACPAAIRFTNVTAHALYGLPSFGISRVVAGPHGTTPYADPEVRSGDVPYLPARQSAVVYFPCHNPVEAPDHGTSVGRTVDEVDLDPLLVHRQDWGFTEDPAFGAGYVVGAGRDPAAPTAALALMAWAAMPPADAAALRARVAATWRGGRALYASLDAAGRARIVPPPGATPDGTLGLAAARLDDDARPAWDVTPYRAACARGSALARLDVWLASADATRADAFSDTLLEACAPRARELGHVAAVASTLWQTRRAPSFSVAPAQQDPGDVAAAAEAAASERPFPLDAAAAGRALAALDDALFADAARTWRDDPRWAEACARGAAVTRSAARARALLDAAGGDDPADRIAALSQGLTVGDGWKRATAAWLGALPEAARAHAVARWLEVLEGGRLRAAQAAALVELLDGDPAFARAVRAAEEASQPFERAAAVAALPALHERLPWALRARCEARDAAGALEEPCLVAIVNVEERLARAPLRRELHGPAVLAVRRLLAAGGGDATESSPVTRSLAAHGVGASALAVPWCDSARRWRAAGDDRMARRTLGTLDAVLPGAACAAGLRAEIQSDERRRKLVGAAVALGVVAAVALAVRRAQRRQLRALDVDAM